MPQVGPERWERALFRTWGKAVFVVFGGLDWWLGPKGPIFCETGQIGQKPQKTASRRLKVRLQGSPKPNQQCARTKTSIGLASLILREACETIRCTEQHFYTMMLSLNRFLRLMAMHSI